MEQKLSAGGRAQLNRFCRQYLQLQLELDYPDEEYLRKDAFQEAIYATLFDESAIVYPPPKRYQLRVLKELTKRIEQSIQDWEEEVCHLLPF
jgi:protein-lysine N-methyltransferase EEF2KMT